jgi:uncharacterized membrane protein YfcA
MRHFPGSSDAAEMIAILGVLVGLVLGLTGAGGSVFAVPLLMFGLDWTLTQAVPVALIAVCASAAFGTLAAWNVSYVRYRAATVIALVGCITAPLGLRFADRLPESWLAAAFAALLTVVALRLIVQARGSPADTRVVRAAVAGDGKPAAGPMCRSSVSTGRLIWTRKCALAISGIGATAGFLSGMLGVGGGFVIVPSLRAATVLSMHSAVATSLMAIALTSAGTVAASMAMGRSLPWIVALPFGLGSKIGMLAGRKIAPRIAGPRLQQGFAVVMLCAAASLIVRAAQ